MRTLIALLLLANLAFFLWSQYVDPPAQREPLAEVGEMTFVERTADVALSPAQGGWDGAPEQVADGTPPGAYAEAVVTDPLPRALQQAELAPAVQATEAFAAVPSEAQVDVAQPPNTGVAKRDEEETATSSTQDALASELLEQAVSKPDVPDTGEDALAKRSATPLAISPAASSEADLDPLDIGAPQPGQMPADPALSDAGPSSPGANAADALGLPMPASVSDRPVDTSVPGAAQAELSSEVVVGQICRRFGPMDDAVAAELLSNLSRGATVVADAVEDYRRDDGGFFVMIPPLPTRSDAEAMLQRLTAAGIDDTWLFRSGDYVNGISLGVFTREATAQRHADDLALRGFDSEVRRRNVVATGRFITLRLPADAPYRSDLSGVAQWETVSCP